MYAIHTFQCLFLYVNVNQFLRCVIGYIHFDFYLNLENIIF